MNANADIAVIIGRYQTYQLHPEQKKMIENVLKNHSRTIIILGNSIMRGTIENPLDFRSRKAMLLENFPNIEILYVTDTPNDNAQWSNNIDKLINDQINNTQSVVIYGSPTTVCNKYCGRFNTVPFEASSYISAEEIRKNASGRRPNEDFRAGVVASMIHRYATAYQCVDVAILKEDMCLFGKKPNETTWRFIGGFSDPKSESLEADAKREVIEETGLEVGDIRYIGSALVAHDSRYLNEVDKIKTAFFVATYVFGRPTPADDIAEVTWIPIKDINKSIINPCHHMLVDMLIKHINLDTV